MNLEEKKKLEEEEKLEREAKERERIKREAKLITKITTQSKRMFEKYTEYLHLKRIFFTIDFSKDTYTIQILGLNLSETNKLMKKLTKQLHLSTTSKQERHAPAA